MKEASIPGNIVRKKNFLLDNGGSLFYVLQHWDQSLVFILSFSPFLPSSLPLFPLYHRSSGLCIHLQHRRVDDPVRKKKWFSSVCSGLSRNTSNWEALWIIYSSEIISIIYSLIFIIDGKASCQGFSFCLTFIPSVSLIMPLHSQTASLSNWVCELGKDGYSRWHTGWFWFYCNTAYVQILPSPLYDLGQVIHSM